MLKRIDVEGQRFITPTSDWGFKRLFATEMNKGLLIGLLNKIIEGPEIEDLYYLDREATLPTIGKEGTVRFDVYCERSDGSRVIVEMQKYARRGFVDRVLVYTAAAILDGYDLMGNDYHIETTYCIAITGNTVFPEIAHAPVRLTLCDADSATTRILNDKVLQIFIELPKFANSVEELTPDDDFLSKFAVALKTMGRSNERPEVMDDDLLVGLYKAADLRHYHPDEMQDYKEQIMNNLEYEATLYDWKTEGFQEGKEEGKGEVKAEIAAMMKADGVPVEKIAKYTGLDEKSIDSL